MTDDAAQEELDRHVAQLMEHFDSVQILATTHDGRITSPYDSGGGNFYARKGQAMEFVEKDTARTVEMVKMSEFAPPDDGEETSDA